MRVMLRLILFWEALHRMSNIEVCYIQISRKLRCRHLPSDCPWLDLMSPKEVSPIQVSLPGWLKTRSGLPHNMVL